MKHAALHAVLKYLAENFNIALITTPEKDLHDILGW